ncbi:MAG: hypothetical protein GY705_12665 [Bacteroidetes bacterium]|nr:hypothetical protein [Bacteroidota bacterium]
MNVIDKIKKKLENYPEVAFEETESDITILPKDSSGFEVNLWKDEKEIIVSFEGWHEHFERSNEEDALNCFALGLSVHSRLKVYSKDGKDYRWTLHLIDLETNEWQFSGTTMVFRLLKFWKSKQIRYLQNSMIKIGAEPLAAPDAAPPRGRA